MPDDTATVASPDQLRNALIDRLRRYQAIQSPAVEHAMRAVPRHVFLPGIDVESAYAGGSVVTHRDSRGVAVSSASEPGTVAMLLEQLDVCPGQRVLEIGAGTGYNAALLAHLAGPDGSVTTVDLIDDVVDRARAHLAAAGYHAVSVICADGEFGYAPHAPYDRIIVTAGAWDLPPAWADQLAPGGRLVVPLRMRGLTRSIAFDRNHGHWRSRSIQVCGFVPIHGAGHVAEHNIFLGRTPEVTVRLDDGQTADAAALIRALDHPPTVLWTGATSADRMFAHLDFWLAELDGYCRMLMHDPHGTSGLVAPIYLWGSMAVARHDSLAYLTTRPTGSTTGQTQQPYELGICAYGPHADTLLTQVADQVHAWEQAMTQTTDLWIEAHPAGAGALPRGRFIIDKRHTTVTVHTR